MKKTALLTAFLMPLFLFSQQIQNHTTTVDGENVGFLEYKPTDYDANNQ